jgi:hypothetical protein
MNEYWLDFGALAKADFDHALDLPYGFAGLRGTNA